MNALVLAVVVVLAALSGCGGGGASTTAPASSNAGTGLSAPGAPSASSPESSFGAPKRVDYPSAIDSSFGKGGHLVFSTGYTIKQHLAHFDVHDFIVDAKGRAVMTGMRASGIREAWVHRILPDGSPDPSCGQNGWLSFTTGGAAAPYKIIQHPDGRYLLGGILGQDSLWALNEADCSVDRSFGDNGQADMPAPTVTEAHGGVNSMAVDGQGRIVATVAHTMSGRLLLARFLPNGALDLSFGDGKGYTSVGPSDGGSARAAALAIRPEPDGRIVVAAMMQYSSQVGHWAGFAQFLSNGQIDRSFGENASGFIAIRPSPNTVANPKDVVILPDGSLIQGGLTQPGVLVGTLSKADAYWAKVSLNGMPDTSFGGQGTGVLIWDASPDERKASSNYVVSMLMDGEREMLSCQNWINVTGAKPQNDDGIASLQAIVQRRSTITGETLDVSKRGAPTTDAKLSNVARRLHRGTGDDGSIYCAGLKRGADGRVYSLLIYPVPQNAIDSTMALVRVVQ